MFKAVSQGPALNVDPCAQGRPPGKAPARLSSAASWRVSSSFAQGYNADWEREAGGVGKWWETSGEFCERERDPGLDLSAQSHKGFDPNRIQNLLEPGDRYRLIIALFIAADHLLADA